MNLLRNSQSYCTDNECVQELPGPNDEPLSGGMSMMLIMLGWVVVATALFLLRPSSLRAQGDTKPARFNGGGNNSPPAPPGVN